MRFSMRRTDVCPVEERRILRKSAFCTGDVTGKRILQVGPHGKAHFGCNHLDPQGGVRMQRRDTRTRSRVLSEGDVLRSNLREPLVLEEEGKAMLRIKTVVTHECDGALRVIPNDEE